MTFAAVCSSCLSLTPFDLYFVPQAQLIFTSVITTSGERRAEEQAEKSEQYTLHVDLPLLAPTPTLVFDDVHVHDCWILYFNFLHVIFT